MYALKNKNYNKDIYYVYNGSPFFFLYVPGITSINRSNQRFIRWNIYSAGISSCWHVHRIEWISKFPFCLISINKVHKMQLLYAINSVFSKLVLKHGKILILLNFQVGMKHWRVSIFAGSVILATIFGLSWLGNK